jgi:hypothetical protein
VELREITIRPEIFDKSVMMSSLMPSEKYSWSASPDMLVKGRTAIDGLSFLAGAGLDVGSAVGLLASAAQDPANWPDIPGQPADTAERLREFESLRRSVERARRRRLSWIVVGIALSYGLLFVRSGVLAAFGVHLAFPL